MRISMMAIGSELLNGRTVEGNGQYLTAQLAQKGLALSESLIVPDHLPILVSRIREMLGRSEVLILSGGLGPTKDDLTKEALAQTVNTSLEYSEAAYAIAMEHYNRLSRPLNQGKEHPYAFVPKGFTAANNPKGLAPALYGFFQQKLIFLLPGVPREFQALVNDLIFPLIHQHFPEVGTKRSLIFRTSGVAEENIFNQLCPNLWDELAIYGSVASLPYPMGVDIVVTLDQNEFETKAKELQKIIHQSALAPFVWSEKMESIGQKILQQLISTQATLATAESCTGGLIASQFTDIAGSSVAFIGSVVAYHEKIKIQQLNVPAQIIKDHGIVSVEVAEAMAKGVQALFRSDWALSTTGNASPPEAGHIAIAAVGPNGQLRSELMLIQGHDREILKYRFAQKAQFFLWQLMLDSSSLNKK